MRIGRLVAPAVLLSTLLGCSADDDTFHVTLLSGAMEPTLSAEERVEVEPIEPDEVERGDVVLLELPDEAIGDVAEFVYRVVGLPGEEMGVEDGALTVDGVALDEPWFPDGTVTPPFFDGTPCDPTCVVGPDELFVLGDNRMNSAASGMIGPVPADTVTGRVRVDD